MIETDRGERRFRVTEITNLIKTALEAEFGKVAVEGEISNFRPSSAGHLYFTLKDDDAMLSAVMFRGRATRLTFKPADGQLVVARGNISVYTKRGVYQIICDSLEPAGEGAILAILEERKKKLAAEGLFEEDRKKPIPYYPSRVAVVTSPTGAAIRDILRVIGRRNAGLDLVVLPTAVQGDDAAPKIAKQIRIANLHRLGEVIIVSRGGGSLEDLLPFSDEGVVRAIAESEIPVISAVGHDVDVSLSDLAADVRAPTPSAAAELVSAQREELYERVVDIRRYMEQTLTHQLERIRLLLRQFTPELLVRNFRVLIQPQLLRLDDAKEDLIRTMRDLILDKHHRLELAHRELEAISPVRTLEKGFAIVIDPSTGKAVKDASTQKPGNMLRVDLANGSLDTKVEEVHRGEKKL